MKWILLTIVIVTSVLADLLQSREMKNAAAANKDETLGLIAIVKAVGTRRYLILAIACMTVSFFAFLALVQTEPLSFAVPASALTFVIETVLARLALKERVDARRAAGTLFVLFGIVLLGR
jgi:drug/metabolite transporter (DMT)-like permease